jgi:hypothetical protein
MAGATPKYALPYPTGTDRVMDGDNAIQALAERVEANVLTGPWIGLPFGAAGWSNYGSTYQVGQYRFCGDGVELRGVLNGPGGLTTVGILPVGYRPPAAVGFAAMSGGAATSLIEIAADGTMLVARGAGPAGSLYIGHVFYSLRATGTSKPGPEEPTEPTPKTDDEGTDQ